MINEVEDIRIIACANTTKILEFLLTPSLKDLYESKGEFSRYQDVEIELTGIISCPGCLGGLAPEAILSKANSLVHYLMGCSLTSLCLKMRNESPVNGL